MAFCEKEDNISLHAKKIPVYKKAIHPSDSHSFQMLISLHGQLILWVQLKTTLNSH